MIVMMKRLGKAPAAAMNATNTLSASMTETAFEHGYWYAVELREFAVRLGIPSASKLRKDQLERAIRQVLRTGEMPFATNPKPALRGPRDVDRGLKLDLAVVHY